MHRTIQAARRASVTLSQPTLRRGEDYDCPPMAATRRIGILTGGGDVPGLNSVIKSVVYRSTALGYSVLGIRRGWEGLTHLRPGSELDSEYVRPLDRANTDRKSTRLNSSHVEISYAVFCLKKKKKQKKNTNIQ